MTRDEVADRAGTTASTDRPNPTPDKYRHPGTAVVDAMTTLTPANPTLEKYRYPDTLVKEYRDWVVLLRPAQVTIGSLVLASTSDAVSFGTLSESAFTELRGVVADIERTLTGLFRYDRINYVMLMINDPNPHFHVIPRYSAPRSFCGRNFADTDWPQPPDLTNRLELSGQEWQLLRSELIAAWPESGPSSPGDPAPGEDS